MSSFAAAPSALDAEVPDKLITLISEDNQEFKVLESLAMHAETLKNMIMDECVDDCIPVPVSAEVIEKVIDFWQRNKNINVSEETVKAKAREFVNEFFKKTRDKLFGIVMVANFLDDKVLIDATTQTIADNIKNLSIEDYRDYMNIVNDYMPKEEAALREQYKWVLEEDGVNKY